MESLYQRFKRLYPKSELEDEIQYLERFEHFKRIVEREWEPLGLSSEPLTNEQQFELAKKIAQYQVNHDCG